MSEEETEVIGSPESSVAELENGVFTLIITLVNHYMYVEGYSKNDAADMAAGLLEKYVVALRSDT